jgi:NIPSNAP
MIAAVRRLISAAACAQTSANDKRGLAVLHELRVYRCVPNRLPALLKRFETTTLRIWEKHGIRQAGFWTTMIGESNHELTYLLAWESLAEREKKWAAFVSDPEWLAGRDESEKDGPIVANVASSILQPTAFSSVR